MSDTLSVDGPVTVPVLVAIMALALTAFVQAAGLLIWGASLTQRVKTLESSAEDHKRVGERLASLEARLDGMFEQLKDLNASIRWMREPAEYTSINPRGKP